VDFFEFALSLFSSLGVLRLRVSDYKQFPRWCDRNNYSQQQGFNIPVANIPKGKG
jgi:hypothetical protein